jgi:tRNA A37 threonylcarbamoyltransferase TsaD
MTEPHRRQTAAQFQKAAVAHIGQKIRYALKRLPENRVSELTSLVVSGGVASNQFLRER